MRQYNTKINAILHSIQKCPVFFAINWTNKLPLQHNKGYENN